MDDSEPLTAEELDFRRDPNVTPLGDGRYLVATARDAAATSRNRTSRARRETRRPGRTDGEERSADSAATGAGAESETSESAQEERRPDYFLGLTARTDEGTFETRVAGDDIGAVCAAMLRWYARRVSPEDDPAEVLSVLLSRSEFSLTAPTADR